MPCPGLEYRINEATLWLRPHIYIRAPMAAAPAMDPRTIPAIAALERVLEVLVAAVKVDPSGAEILLASKELALSSAEVASIRTESCQHMNGRL